MKKDKILRKSELRRRGVTNIKAVLKVIPDSSDNIEEAGGQTLDPLITSILHSWRKLKGSKLIFLGS